MSFWMNDRNRADEKRIPERIQQVIKNLKPVRAQLTNHPIYLNMQSMEDLYIYMQHHCFAVWDFMALVKNLQYHLSSVRTPWVPKGNPNVRRLINHIVLSEETDEDGQGGFKSHFELYMESMREVGANPASIEQFVELMWRRWAPAEALEVCGAPRAAKEFVKNTLGFCDDNKVHIVAAVFTFSREDVVPDMFRSIVNELRVRHPERFNRFCYYLDRHIAVDSEDHGPMAFEMVASICGDDDRKWAEAEAAAASAIRARIRLWDAVLQGIIRTRLAAGGVPLLSIAA